MKKAEGEGGKGGKVYVGRMGDDEVGRGGGDKEKR